MSQRAEERLGGLSIRQAPPFGELLDFRPIMAVNGANGNVEADLAAQLRQLTTQLGKIQNTLRTVLADRDHLTRVVADLRQQLATRDQNVQRFVLKKKSAFQSRPPDPKRERENKLSSYFKCLEDKCPASLTLDSQNNIIRSK